MKNWRHSGLLDFVTLLLDVLEPFSVLGAQVLWVAKPTLGLVIAPEKITAWAEMLEDPQNIASFREQLAQKDFYDDN